MDPTERRHFSPLDERSVRMIVDQLRAEHPDLFDHYANPERTKSRWDGTITMGNVLTIFFILLALIGTSVNISNRLTAIETKLEPVWLQYEREHETEQTHEPPPRSAFPRGTGQ